MSTPETEIRAPALGGAGEQCAHCGAELAPDQRYCVNCGLRRAGPRVEYRELLAADAPAAAATAPEPALPAAPATAPPPAPSDTRTVSPLGAAVAIGLLLLAVLLGAVIGKGGDTNTPAPVVVGAAAAGAAGAFQSDWTGGDGWTIRLVVLPKSSTQPAQVAAAKADAQGKGAADVGALDSDAFASLPGGVYVVYSGHYDTKAQAEAALSGVKANVPDATVVEVSTTAAGAAGAAGAAAGGAATKGTSGSSTPSTAAPKPSAAKKSKPTPSTQNYIQKSKKLPDKVGTGGTPPPADNKAPGGGSQGTTIG